MSQGMLGAQVTEAEAREASALISDTAQALAALENDRSHGKSFDRRDALAR